MYSILVVILIELAFLIVLFFLVTGLLTEISKSKATKEARMKNEKRINNG